MYRQNYKPVLQANEGLKVQTQRPYIEFEGCKYYCGERLAVICDMLLKANGKVVTFAAFLAYLDQDTRKVTEHDRQVLRVHIWNLKQIVEPLGYMIVNRYPERKCWSPDKAERGAGGYSMFKDFTRKI